jgi:hypothetical protein
MFEVYLIKQYDNIDKVKMEVYLCHAIILFINVLFAVKKIILEQKINVTTQKEWKLKNIAQDAIK